MTATDRLVVCLMDGHKYAKNPYMSLLRDALGDAGVDVRTSELPLFFPLTRTAVRSPDVDVLQLDWITHYYAINPTGVHPIDSVLTVFRAVTFLVDLIVARLLPVAIVRTVHNRRNHEGEYRRTERVVNEVLLAVADAVTVKCDAARHILESSYTLADATRIHVVSDGSYVSTYENEVSRATARRDLSIADDAFVYLFFGHVRPYKGIPELVEAFDDLGAPDAELWIVGTPQDEVLERDLERRAADADDLRTVLRFVPDDRVQYYMNAADVLVLPYRKILNSGSARLGLSFGLPVVAPAIGCLPETLPADNEFLYDPGVPDGLATALLAAHDHPELARIGAANYDHACAQTWADTAAAYLEVYQRAIDPSATPPETAAAGADGP